MLGRLCRGACLLLLAGGGACKKKEEAPPPPPPPAVLVAPVEQRDVPLVQEYVGALDGYVNAEIRARVPGFLQEQHYLEGSKVKEGQLLFTIDPREYEAAAAQARGVLARARANLDIATVTVRRLRPLVEKQAVSQQDLDNALATQQEARAAVATAQAALQRAELNLSYTRVASPLSGIAGRALVGVGNVVGQGEPTLLTTVSQVEPIRARFSVTEREYLRFRKERLEGAEDGGSPRRLEERVQLVLATGELYPHPGRLVFAGREVDPTTGTLQLDALFPNVNDVLRPGQYARVRVTSDTLRNALLIPQRALNEVQGTFQVGVVGDDGVAHVRTVQLGPAVGGRSVVEQGLQPGDRVIVEGLQRVKDGRKVEAKPAPPSLLAAGDGGTPGPEAGGEPGVGGAADAGTGGAGSPERSPPEKGASHPAPEGDR